MKLTQEQERQYEENRLHKNHIDRGIRLIAMGFVLIAVFFYVFSLFATAETSADPNIRGAWKWYYGINAASWNIVFAVCSLVLGIISAARSRVATILLAVLYVGIILWVLLGQRMAMAGGNLSAAIVGLILAVRLYMYLLEDEALREQPGYPLFVARAEHEEYEPSPVIMRHPESGEMESIGGAAATASPKEQPAALSAPVGLETESLADAALPVRTQTDSAMERPKDIALETMRDTALPEAHGAPAPVSPEGILSAMDTGRHSTTQGGDPSMLPDPDEVRARLAKMRAEREAAGQQQGTAQ